MLPYWILFLFFAVGASLSAARPTVAAAGPLMIGENVPAGTPRQAEPMFAIGLLLVALMIGLRFEVGADWSSYLRIFERTVTSDLSQELSRGDPAYQFINWAVRSWRGELWQVNSACGSILALGLYRFARQQPEPWLVLVVAAPYMITVVAMGYTRQAAALGILMMGLAGVLRGGGMVKFAFYVFVAALFHRTAVVMLPLMMFAFPRSRLTDLLIVVSVSASLYVLLLQEAVEGFQRNYLEARYSSQGAVVRIAQLALASGIFFMAGRGLRFGEQERRMWRNFSIVVLLTVLALILSPSSTAVDRMSLYLLPVQLAVLARIPLWWTSPVLGRLLVIAYSALVLFVWLNYAAHAFAWLPYQTIFQDGAL